MKIRHLPTAQDFERFDKTNYSGSLLKLARDFGSTRLGFHLEVMDPKTFSAPFHYHTDEEEFFYVIEGEAIIRHEGGFKRVGPGDLIFYGLGPSDVHQMYNFTDKPFRFLAVSNKSESDDCFYPDSRKRTSPEGILQDGHIVDYFKDEEDPRIYWPEWALRGLTSAP